jgi:glycerophosphoryl diester phosphodiesterase
VPLIIELKTNDPELARLAIEDVRAEKAADRVAFGSFGWRVLRTARRLEPVVPTGASREEVRLALYRSWVRWPLGKEAYREFQVPERSGPTRIVSRHFIAHAHPRRTVVKVWTVNELPTCGGSSSGALTRCISDRRISRWLRECLRRALTGSGGRIPGLRHSNIAI